MAAAAELKGQVKALQEQVSGLQMEVSKKQVESEAFAQGKRRRGWWVLGVLCSVRTDRTLRSAGSLLR